MPEAKLKFMYVLVTDGGSEFRLIKPESAVEHLREVSDAEVEILRFLAFSDAAKEMSPHTGRIDRMEVTGEEADEDDGDDTSFDEGTDPLQLDEIIKDDMKYDISWSTVR